MNKMLYILICLTPLFSSTDAEQSEVEYVIKPKFDNAGTGFSEGLAAVKVGEKWGYLSKESFEK